MNSRRPAVLAVLALTVVTAVAAQEYEPPRAADGRPLLEGVWTNASLTGLTRPRGLDLILSPAEAEELASGHFHKVRAAADLEPSDPNREPEAVERLPPVGNYNAFWVDPGSVYAEVGDRLYEYACHEGNYAMGGILRGARLAESEAAEDP